MENKIDGLKWLAEKLSPEMAETKTHTLQLPNIIEHLAKEHNQTVDEVVITLLCSQVESVFNKIAMVNSLVSALPESLTKPDTRSVN